MVTRDDLDGLTVDGCYDCETDNALCAMHETEWLRGTSQYEQTEPDYDTYGGDS